MSNHAENTATLNTLIATLIDSVEGYEKSARDAACPQFSQLFAARAHERQQAVAQLQTAVVALGETPKDSGSLMGSIHRAFLSLREAVSTRDDAAIIAEIHHGEHYLKDKFETALDSDTLAAAPRAAVQSVWNSVKAGHDEMWQLNQAVQNNEPRAASSAAGQDSRAA